MADVLGWPKRPPLVADAGVATTPALQDTDVLLHMLIPTLDAPQLPFPVLRV